MSKKEFASTASDGHAPAGSVESKPVGPPTTRLQTATESNDATEKGLVDPVVAPEHAQGDLAQTKPADSSATVERAIVQLSPNTESGLTSIDGTEGVNRTSRMPAVVGAILILLGSTLLLLFPEVRAQVLTREAALGLGVLLLLGGVMTLLIRYLGGASTSDEVLRFLGAALAAASFPGSSIFAAGAGRAEKPTQRARARSRAAISSSPDPKVPAAAAVLAAMESAWNAGEGVRQGDTERAPLRKACSLLRSRILDEIAALTRRGNVNLAIGVVTTMLAAGILALVAINAPEKVADWHDILPQLGLRISLAIFVEVFSFFFLRLYRSNLADIKYFQNELTNVDLKIVALELSLLNGNDEPTKHIVSSLLATERNFVLRQGETTIEIERTKLEGQSTKETVEGLVTIAKTIKG